MGDERPVALAVVAFVLGICVADIVALVRVLVVGPRNAPLFGMPVHVLRYS